MWKAAVLFLAAGALRANTISVSATAEASYGINSSVQNSVQVFIPTVQTLLISFPIAESQPGTPGNGTQAPYSVVNYYSFSFTGAEQFSVFGGWDVETFINSSLDNVTAYGCSTGCIVPSVQPGIYTLTVGYEQLNVSANFIPSPSTVSVSVSSLQGDPDILIPGAPEPATWALMLLGVGALGFGARRGNQG